MTIQAGSLHPAPVSTDDLRKVQRTGQSSLAVTLPKAWTEALNLRAGSELRFKDLGEGRLELSVAGDRFPAASPQKVLNLDVTELAPNLIGRLLIGAYITGQDAVVLTSREPLTADQLECAHEVVRRTVGAGTVSEQATRVEIQFFVDPTKHRLPSLIDHLVRMIHHQVEACEKALVEGDPSSLSGLGFVEDEIDRFYLLIVRQLLLASDDFRVAREVGVASHHYQIGDRLVAKMLEVIGDLVHKVGQGLDEDLSHGDVISSGSKSELVRMLATFSDLLTQTMKAFVEVSPAVADEALEGVHAALRENSTLAENVARRSTDKLAAVRLQRMVIHLSTALEMLRVINEITINRAVEPENTRTNTFAFSGSSGKR